MALEQTNDAKYGTLRVTDTGQLDAMFRRRMEAVVGKGGSERDYWLSLFPTGVGGLNDIKTQYFRSLALTTSTDLQDMENAYWASLSP